MTREEIQRRIRSRQTELAELGVKSLELFGSAARNQHKKGSDVDLLVTFNRPVGFLRYFEIQEFLEDLLEAKKIDLVPRESVYDEFKADIFKDAVSCL